MYPLLFIGLYYTFIFEFWQLPNSHLALTLNLLFYIVYPSKMQRQILFDIVIEFLFVIVLFLGQLLFIC